MESCLRADGRSTTGRVTYAGRPPSAATATGFGHVRAQVHTLGRGPAAALREGCGWGSGFGQGGQQSGGRHREAGWGAPGVRWREASRRWGTNAGGVEAGAWCLGVAAWDPSPTSSPRATTITSRPPSQTPRSKPSWSVRRSTTNSSWSSWPHQRGGPSQQAVGGGRRCREAPRSYQPAFWPASAQLASSSEKEQLPLPYPWRGPRPAPLDPPLGCCPEPAPTRAACAPFAPSQSAAGAAPAPLPAQFTATLLPTTLSSVKAPRPRPHIRPPSVRVASRCNVCGTAA